MGQPKRIGFINNVSVLNQNWVAVTALKTAILQISENPAKFVSAKMVMHCLLCLQLILDLQCTKAVAQKCSENKVFLKILQN